MQVKSNPSLIIGLPSLNEANTIGKLSCDLDSAFNSSEIQSIISEETTIHVVNADCRSDDNTPSVFLQSDSNLHKVVLEVERGKGNAIRALLEYTCEKNAEGILLVDSDLPHVPREWLVKFLKEVRQGKDLIFPRRPPTWNGGDLTYQCCFPVLAAVWGALMHEPICGDIYISRRLAETVLNDLPNAFQIGVSGYGIDFFIAMHGANYLWSEVFMETRKGNPLRSFKQSKPSMGNKFLEVFGTVGDCIKRRLGGTLPQTSVDKLIVREFGKTVIKDGAVPNCNEELEQIGKLLPKNISALESILSADIMQALSSHLSAENFSGIPFSIWIESLLPLLVKVDYSSFDSDLTKAAESLFLSRVVGHYHEIRGKPSWYHTVEDQAIYAFNKRQSLINGIKTYKNF